MLHWCFLFCHLFSLFERWMRKYLPHSSINVLTLHIHMHSAIFNVGCSYGHRQEWAMGSWRSGMPMVVVAVAVPTLLIIPYLIKLQQVFYKAQMSWCHSDRHMTFLQIIMCMCTKWVLSASLFSSCIFYSIVVLMVLPTHPSIILWPQYTAHQCGCIHLPLKFFH